MRRADEARGLRPAQRPGERGGRWGWLGVLAVTGGLVWGWGGLAQAMTCVLALNQGGYTNGQMVTITTIQFTNPGTSMVAAELKLWVSGPGVGPVGLLNAGADGSVQFAAGFNQNFGPVTLFTVSSGLPRGIYTFGCRLRDPVTGALLAESLNPFTIQ